MAQLENGRSLQVDDDPNLPQGHGKPSVTVQKLFVVCAVILALFGTMTSAVLIAVGWIVLAAALPLGALRYRAQDRVQLSLTVVLVVCIATPVTRLPGVTTLLVVAFTLVVGSSVAIGIVGGRAWRPTRGLGSLLLMLSTLALSTVAAGNSDSLVQFAAIVVLPVLGCFALAHRLDTASRRSISLVIIALGVLESGLAVAEVVVLRKHLGPPAQLDDSGIEKVLSNELLPFLVVRAQGTLGHPLALAFLLAVGIALVLRAPRLHPALRWSAVAMLAVGIIATGSRSAVIFSVLVIAFVPLRKVTLGRVLTAGLGAALVVLLLVSMGFAFDRIFADFTGTGSYLHRLGAIDAAYRLWSTQDVVATFLGNGYGSTARLFEEGILQSDGFNAVDNQLVLLLAQGGLIAMLSFVTISFVAVVLGHWTIRAAVMVVVANSFVFDWMNWPSAAAVGFTVIGAALVALPNSSGTEALGETIAEAQPSIGRARSADQHPDDPPGGDHGQTSGPSTAKTCAAGLSSFRVRPPPISS